MDIEVKSLKLMGGQQGNLVMRGGNMEIYGNFDNSEGATFKHLGGEVR